MVNDKFVAASNTKKIAYSSDGITWTDAVIEPGTFNDLPSPIYSFAYGNNCYITGCSSGEMAYSTNGTTWKAIPGNPFKYLYVWGDDYYDIVDAVRATIYDISFGNGKFVAANFMGKTAVSSDGLTWTIVYESSNTMTIKACSHYAKRYKYKQAR
jgi:hypothetical protein